MTAVDELKCPDCSNATEETEKDAEVEKSDYVDEDTIDLDKLKLSKKRPKEVFEHDERWQIITNFFLYSRITRSCVTPPWRSPVMQRLCRLYYVP